MIKVGIIGVGRGISFVKAAPHCGMKLVALCDRWKTKMQPYRDNLDVATYTDYDAFLEHDMDAVILANNFHQHAPCAIKALEAGLHVLSETAACGTLGEGVALARAVEKSGKIYMFGENYQYSAINQEMKCLYEEGFAGKFRYGEGEYVHPMDAWQSTWYIPYFDHWRAWIPATYYCTHSMGPIMFITGTRPVKVNGFVVPRDLEVQRESVSITRKDTASMIVCRMDNQALVKLLQGGLAAHHGHVSIFGDKGMMEKANDGSGRLLLHKEAWHTSDGKKFVKDYVPVFRQYNELAAKTGHSGGDYFVEHYFAEAIRRNQPPFMDVYRGIDMSIIGIQAFRSALQDGAAVDVPDFRDENVRLQYENDDWTPDPAKRKPGQPYSSVLGDIQPPEKAKIFAELVWQEQKKHWEGKPWKQYNPDFTVKQEFGPDCMRNLTSLKTLEYGMSKEDNR
ncbi:MAG: Gfo/Idh/MocA family protein [Kiritimatiellia bacterium]|jgi:predicted dehydrogenase